MAAESQKQTDWSDVADWYDDLVGEEGSEYHRKVVLPGVLKLLGAQEGERVLDVACGQGVLGRLLGGKGVRSLGVDASRELIRIARQRATEMPLATYQMMDARELHPLAGQNFTAAACVLAIQNVDPLKAVFTGVAAALAPGGKFVLAMTHPCFRGAKASSWGWDADKTQYRRVDRYLIPRKIPITTRPGAKTGEYTWTFHKPLEYYIKTLRNAGFLLDALEEWPSHKTSEPSPRAAAENTARKEIPLFLALRAVRVP